METPIHLRPNVRRERCRSLPASRSKSVHVRLSDDRSLLASTFLSTSLLLPHAYSEFAPRQSEIDGVPQLPATSGTTPWRSPDGRTLMFVKKIHDFLRPVSEF